MSKDIRYILWQEIDYQKSDPAGIRARVATVLFYQCIRNKSYTRASQRYPQRGVLTNYTTESSSTYRPSACTAQTDRLRRHIYRVEHNSSASPRAHVTSRRLRVTSGTDDETSSREWMEWWLRETSPIGVVSRRGRSCREVTATRRDERRFRRRARARANRGACSSPGARDSSVPISSMRC